MAYPIKITFHNPNDFGRFVGDIAKAFGVYSRTNRAKAERILGMTRKLSAEDLHDSFDVVLPKHFGVRIDAVLYAIAWGKRTGRFHLGAESFISGLSGYQFSKLVIKLAMTEATMQDVVDYFNGGYSLTLPVLAA